MKDHTRSDYRYFVDLQTRWMDNDSYAHVNNVNYYSFFDTAVNHLLISGGALHIRESAVVALVVESLCSFYQSVSFPDVLEIGLRVAKLGRSSVRYDIGIFRKGEPRICAAGYFVHVYVDKTSQIPAPIPEASRRLLQEFQLAQ